jgi:hypothetical protein
MCKAAHVSGGDENSSEITNTSKGDFSLNARRYHLPCGTRMGKRTLAPTSQVEAVAEITPGKGKGRSELVVGAWRSELQTS